MSEKSQNMANWKLICFGKTTRQRKIYLTPLAREDKFHKKSDIFSLETVCFFSENENFGSPVFWKKNLNLASQRFRWPISNFSSIKFQPYKVAPKQKFYTKMKQFFCADPWFFRGNLWSTSEKYSMEKILRIYYRDMHLKPADLGLNK